MKPIPSIVMALASLAIAGGCASPASRIDLPQHHIDLPQQRPGWIDTGTPLVRIALERDIRHYVDDAGNVLDERGRN